MFQTRLSAAVAEPVAQAKSDIDRLIAAEYGSRLELAFRLFVVTLSGTAYSYTTPPDYRGYYWVIAYLLLQAATFALLKTAPDTPSRLRSILALGSYFATASVFFSLPVALVLTGEPILAYCAGIGLASLFIFTIWRQEPPPVLLPFDIFLGWVTGAALLWRFFPLAETVIAQIITVLLTVTLLIYFSMTLYMIRRDQTRLRVAAERSLEAQKMEALGRLSGGIAHDFNNILTVVQGNLELYRELGDAADKSELIEEAHHSALRASGLARHLLSFARQAPLAPRALAADEVMNTVNAMSKRLLPASIEVAMPPVPAKLTVRTDLDALISALLNLIINARDAVGQSGHIVVWASAATADELRRAGLCHSGRAFVGFHVRDNGPGLPEAAQSKIFEPFFTTKPVGQGVGLGLPSAKGFAEQSGGSLSVDSRPGDTVFSLYLRRVAGGAEPV